MKTQNKSVRNFLEDWIPKVLAFITAVLVVLAIRVFNIDDRVVTIPLRVDIDSESEFYPASLVPTTVDIVISGDDSIIYLVDPTTITAVADFSEVADSGIIRKPVVLEYDHNIYDRNSLTLEAQPSSVRILFEKRGEN